MTIHQESSPGTVSAAPETLSVSHEDMPAHSSSWDVLRYGFFELDGRIKRLSNLFEIQVIALFGVVVLAGFIFGVAELIEPSDVITRLHVPAQIQEQFNDTFASNTLELGTEVEQNSSAHDEPRKASIADINSHIIGLLGGTLGRLLAGVMVLGGVLAGVMRMSMMSFMSGVGGGVLLYSLPVALQSHTEASGHIERLPERQHQQVANVEVPERLKSLQYDQLVKALSRIEHLPAGERAYLLGQSAIQGEVPNSGEIIREAAAFVREGIARFEVPASIAYAIEKQADGTLKSELAVELDETRGKQGRQIASLGYAVALIGIVMLLSGGFLGGLILYLQRRVSRVREMLGQLGCSV